MVSVFTVYLRDFYLLAHSFCDVKVTVRSNLIDEHTAPPYSQYFFFVGLISEQILIVFLEIINKYC